MSAQSGWDSYIYDLINFWSKAKKDYTKKNCCSAAAIFTHQGALLAASPSWAGCKEMEVDVEQEDWTTKKVKVNEWDTLVAASIGNGNPKPCGVRFGNEKYLMRSFEEGISILGRNGGGGATIVRTKQLILVGLWEKEGMMGN